MWHLKTQVGTFWILKKEANDPQYLLGCEDEDLGEYQSLEGVLKDLKNQETGYLKWDEQLNIKAPDEIDRWEQGVPEHW